MDIYNKLAEKILNSPDSKKEIVWLLKIHFKFNITKLKEAYKDFDLK